MPEYPGEYIPTVLVQRADGTKIYVSSKEYHSNPSAGSFAENYYPPLTRPEVCRKYRTIDVSKPMRKGTAAYFDSYGRVTFKGKHKAQYRLEEISE